VPFRAHRQRPSSLDPPMERSSRRDRSRDPEEDISSDTGDSTRLRSRRMRDARSSAADSTSDGADTDASSAGTPQRRRRRSSARKAVEDPPKTTRELRSSDERHSSLSGDEEEDEHEDARNHEDDAAGRKRSLSNVSNTSSTSASSMASEPLTAEQRRAHVDQQMAELEQKKKMVEDGTLAEFCRRVTAFKEERNRLLQTAELHKNLQLKNGQDLYKFEVQRAQHLWQNDRKVLKDELLAKVDAVMAKLQAEMKVLSEPGAKITDVYKQTEPKPEAIDAEAEKPAVFVAVVASDKQASEPEQEEGEVPEPPVAPKEVLLVKRRKMDPNACADPVEVSKLLPVEAVRLAFDDITADIAAIAGDCKKTSQSTVEQLPNHGNGKACGLALTKRLVLTYLLCPC